MELVRRSWVFVDFHLRTEVVLVLVSMFDLFIVDMLSMNVESLDKSLKSLQRETSEDQCERHHDAAGAYGEAGQSLSHYADVAPLRALGLWLRSLYIVYMLLKI